MSKKNRLKRQMAMQQATATAAPPALAASQSSPNTTTPALAHPPAPGAEQALANAAHALAAASPDASANVAAEVAAIPAVSLKSRDVGQIEQLTRRLNEVRTQFESDRAQYKQLKAMEAEQNRREADLRTRELDAEAGFALQHRKVIADFDGQLDAARTELADLQQRLRTEAAAARESQDTASRAHDAAVQHARDALAQELRERRDAFEADLRVRREELAAEEGALSARDRELRKERHRLAAELSTLKDDRDLLQEKIERLANARVNDLESALTARLAERDAARVERDRLRLLFGQREELDARFEGKSPADILELLRSLQADGDELRRQLILRPGAEVGVRVKQLELERESADSLILELRREKAQLESQAARNRTAVTELEALRDEKRALEKANTLLTATLEQLESKVDAYVLRADQATVFPACSGFDSDASLQVPPSLKSTRLSSLKSFATEIRDRMAADPDGALFYAPRTVRSLLAGLHMSRLHILQGISGTGKTSLPRAFSRAVDAGLQLVEVQAGWRDRQDLIGHYNAFERRYYETEFLQAIYRAQTPYYENRINVVILDEMNLSRPEQYFADLLSALEQPSGERCLTLLPHVPPSAPTLLKKGRILSIPENIWFIGTANHDETTVEFADKTYDRAHIMELPSQPDPFSPTPHGERPPVEFSALQTAFQAAESTHAREAEQVLSFLEAIRKPLLERFDIAWANRLERQVRKYAPVVVAAGGSAAEAADDLLELKILRKLRHRHDTRPADLKSTLEDIRVAWRKQMDSASEPVRSLRLLTQELQRLRGADLVSSQS